ncbi:MAG: hypothetical protein ACUVV1_09840 [Fimbriimonadales bacterium]
MRRFVVLITVCAVLMGGVAQQSKAPQPQDASPNQQPAQSRAQKQPEPPKPGTFTAEGRQINFFSRGEGTLVFRGRGYLVINTVEGKVQVEGFREVKELPRGARIKPPLSERLKVYMGQGTVRIEGKYDSVRAVLRDVRIGFRGVAAFTLQGTGTANIDGTRRELTPVSAFTLLVPEPKWQAEDDVKPQTPKDDR